MTSIHFYFDFGSPYGYLASTQIGALATKHGAELDWRPMMLGPALQATGNKPNFLVPVKGDYAQVDIKRTAHDLAVPLTMPAKFPIVSLLAARSFYWLQANHPDQAVPFAQAAYRAHWGQGRDITKREEIIDIANSLQLSADALIEGANTPEFKTKLKAATADAVAAGVFGSPFFIIDGEPFWGVDKLAQIDRWLASGGW